MRIARPAFRYYGGKFLLASWVVSFFPPHIHYIEPCGGAGSALLYKPPSKLETFNDIYYNVVNFFMVLRDHPEEFVRKVKLTPWSRREYDLHREPIDDPIEKARRFWVGCQMSIGCMPFTSSGWRHATTKFPGRGNALIGVDHLYVVAERLKMVQIENRDYREVLERYDAPGHMIYMDPPYKRSERTWFQYHHEWTDEMHIEAASLLRQCKSYIVISGYACDLYTELYEKYGWQRHDKSATTNTGGVRIESIWLSPNVPSIQQMKLF